MQVIGQQIRRIYFKRPFNPYRLDRLSQCDTYLGITSQGLSAISHDREKPGCAFRVGATISGHPCSISWLFLFRPRGHKRRAHPTWLRISSPNQVNEQRS
jgi:hypothetical protein